MQGLGAAIFTYALPCCGPQAEMDVLYPALEALGAGGRRAVQAAWPRGEAVETGALELLTLRRERAWGALPQCAQRLRRAYEAHVAELRASALPMLAGRVSWRSAGSLRRPALMLIFSGSGCCSR